MSKLKAMMFDAPIPGESLTKDPGLSPWERPPDIEDAEEALQYHIERFQDPKRLDAAMTVLSNGMPLKSLVSSMMYNEAGKGVHTTHVGRIIAPVVHEYLAGAARKAKIKFSEGLENEQELPPARELKRPSKPEPKREAMPMPEMVQEEPAPEKKGFMKRPEKREM